MCVCNFCVRNKYHSSVVVGGSGRDIKINSTVEARINKRFQVICNTENMKTCGAIPWLNEISPWQVEGGGGGMSAMGQSLVS